MLNLHYKRCLALGIAVTVALTAVLVLREWATPRAAAIATVPTGASFNLAVARFRSERQATVVAANVEASGLPAFTRSLRNGEWRQVVVVPYVSIDEVEAARRLLARRGFGHARMLVDESVRRTPGVDAVATIETARGPGPFDVARRPGPFRLRQGFGGPPKRTARRLVGPGVTSQQAGVVVVAVAGRLSVVVEMPAEPRQVLTRRPAGTVLEVDAGPVTTAIAHQEWNAPDGVDLINQVSVEEHEGLNGTFLRTRVTTPALTQSNVRVVGRRVYIDFWSPESRRDEPLRASRSIPMAEEDEEEIPAGDPEEEYREAIGPVVARFDDIEPFLLSAVASPTPEVLAAIAKTLGSVQEWIRTIEAPKESASTHDSLVDAINQAGRAVAADFEGDRATQARQAAAQFHAAATKLPATDN